MNLKTKLLKVTVPLLTLLTLLISPIFLFDTAYAAGETANASIYIENVSENNKNYADVSVCLENTGLDFNAGNMTLAIEFDTNQINLQGADKFSQVYKKGIYSDTDGYNAMEINQPNSTSQSPFTFEIKRGSNDGGGLAVPDQNELIGTARFEIVNGTTNDYGINWFTIAPLSDLYTSNSSDNQISVTYMDPIVGGKCWDSDDDGVKNSEDPDDNDPCIPNSDNSGCGTQCLQVVEDLDNDGYINTDSCDDNDPNDNDPCIPDTTSGTCDADNDGIINSSEIAGGTNPNKADTDDDGEDDLEESLFDTDNDGKIDAIEPDNVDSDNDGVMDEMDSNDNDPCIPNTCQISYNVNINNISLSSDQSSYVVDFTTIDYTNTQGGYHTHFYYDGESNTVKDKMYTGTSPYSLSVSTNTEGYTRLCAIVGNPDHTIISGTGNCVDLPEIQTTSSSSSSYADSSSSESSSISVSVSSSDSTDSSSSSSSSIESSSSSSSSVSIVDDNDGVDTEAENNAPNNGDANNDGILDSQQPNVMGIKNTSSQYTVFQFNQCQEPSPAILEFKQESTVGNDPLYQYPFGLAEFEVNCSDTINIDIYWYGVDRNKNYIVRKYGKVTPTAAKSYYNINATKSFITIDGQNVLKVSYSLTDNGAGDDNPLVGKILDPIGISEVIATNTPVAQRVVTTPRTGGALSVLYYVFVSIFGIIVARYIIKELKR